MKMAWNLIIDLTTLLAPFCYMILKQQRAYIKSFLWILLNCFYCMVNRLFLYQLQPYQKWQSKKLVVASEIKPIENGNEYCDGGFCIHDGFSYLGVLEIVQISFASWLIFLKFDSNVHLKGDNGPSEKKKFKKILKGIKKIF